MEPTEPYQTLPTLFRDAVRRGGDQAAYHEKVAGSWRTTTYRELENRVTHVARSLVEAGLARGDRAALLSHNQTAWAVVDLGLQVTGIWNVPIYPSSSPEQILYILEDSGCRVFFVEDSKQLEKVREIRSQAKALELVVVIRGEGVTCGDGERTLEEFEASGGELSQHDNELAARGEAVALDDIASIVYTSGTTGPPKGVMLCHRNFAHNVRAAQSIVALGPDDHHLSFLPLSHVFERTVGYYVPLIHLCQVHFAEGQPQLAANMKEVRPTFMTSVPRLYEKIRDGIVKKAQAAGGWKQALFEWAVDAGSLRAEFIQGGAMPGFFGRLALLVADKLVFGKIREAFGGRLRFFVSGGAPLSPELGRFFLGAGIPVLEGYGLTETTPMISANSPDFVRLGTVGRPLPEVEVTIAEDGEILVKGPNVMKGYFGKPEATAEVLEEDGTFHTGDIGEFTDEGALRITDRKKNLLVLSNGKNVAPGPIEGMLINCPWISQAVVLGDNRKFVSALVVPDFEALRHHPEHGALADDPEAVCESEPLRTFFLAQVEERTAECNPYEVPKKVALLPRELSEAEGELTPTLKVKRKVVTERYESVIDSIYS